MKQILLLLIFTLFIGCNKVAKTEIIDSSIEDTDSIIVSSQSDSNESLNPTISEFQYRLDSAYNQGSSLERVCRLAHSNMFYESESLDTAYISLFNWLLREESEEATEAISSYMFEMLNKYPNKFKEFNTHLSKLEIDYQKRIIESFITFFSFEFWCKFTEILATEDLKSLLGKSNQLERADYLTDRFGVIYPFFKERNCLADIKSYMESFCLYDISEKEMIRWIEETIERNDSIKANLKNSSENKDLQIDKIDVVESEKLEL